MVAGCEEEFDKMSTRVVLISIVPISFSLITLLLLCSSLIKVKRMVSICEDISSSAHWLSRTAVRAGIGETARSTIADYAQTKPELHRLTK